MDNDSVVEKTYTPPDVDPNEGKGETNPEGVIDNPLSIKNTLGYNPGDEPRSLYDDSYEPPTGRPLTHIDVLSSHGLVQIWDPTVDNGIDKPQGAYRQISKEAALRLIENLEQLKEQLGEES